MDRDSGRSIETYNMFDKLCEHKELFVKVGGHPMAAGFTITREALEPLREALNRDCNLTDADLVEKLYVDESCAIKQLTLPLYEELAKRKQKDALMPARLRSAIQKIQSNSMMMLEGREDNEKI